MELAWYGSRDYVFAAAQQTLQQYGNIPTIQASDLGIQVDADQQPDNIFKVQTEVILRENEDITINALQVIGMSSQVVYLKTRVRDLEFYISSRGYEDKGPGGETVMKFYMCIRFIDPLRGGYGLYWRTRDCGIIDKELQIAREAAEKRGFPAMNLQEAFFHMKKTGHIHLTTNAVTKECGEEIVRNHEAQDRQGAGDACVWFRLDPHNFEGQRLESVSQRRNPF